MNSQRPIEFADGKAPDAFRTIGEVAQAFGLRQHVLRYWEEQFPMLRPLKRAGGRRYYRPEDIHLVGEINRLLYHEGFTIRGARQALGAKPGAGAPPARAGEPVAPADGPGPGPSAPGASLGTQLRAVREDLSRALHQG